MLLNRHHIKAFWQALLVLLAFASCINDDFADDVTCAATEGDPFYLSLQVQVDASGASTRATGNTFESGIGTHAEHEVGPKGNYVILFDDNGKLFGVYPLTMTLQDVEHKDNSEGSEYDEEPDGTSEGSYLRLLHVYPRNGKLPESCLVILNANNAISEKLEGYDKTGRTSMSLDNVLKETWEWEKEGEKEKAKDPTRIGFVADNGTDYFTMTNSVYIGENNVIKDVVSIKNKIYPTIQEALKNPTTVYVERMVSKFSFSESEENENHFYQLEKTGDTTEEQVWLFDGYDSKEGSLDPDDDEDVGILKTKDITELCKIEVTGWGINALETRNHLFKNIGTPDNSWSDGVYKRYHWSADPHYDYNKDAGNATWRYPWQYRSAVERKDIDYYSNVGYTSPLKNYSYMDFVDETKGIYGNEDRFDRVVYTPENTYDPTLYMNENDATYLDMRTNLLAGTHLIICAEFLVDEGVKNAKTGTTITLTGKYAKIHLYRDRLNVYYKTKKECLAELIRQFNHDLKTQSIMKFHYYNWDPSSHDPNDGKVFTFKSEEAFQLYEQDGSNYTRTTVKYLQEKFQNIPDDMDIDLDKATVLNGDGKLVPWTDELIGSWVIRKHDGTSYIEPKIYGENYDENNDETKTEVTDLDPTNVLKSLLYEWVGAIDHFHYGKMYYAAPIMHNAVNKQEAYRSQNTLGDYGVVRNHWYKINLTNIVRIGTPVDVPMDPIVPNRVITNDQIHFKIDIPNWHEIETVVPIL